MLAELYWRKDNGRQGDNAQYPLHNLTGNPTASSPTYFLAFSAFTFLTNAALSLSMISCRACCLFSSFFLVIDCKSRMTERNRDGDVHHDR